MSVDDVWSLQEQISQILSARITKGELEKRLAALNRGGDLIEGTERASHNTYGKMRRRNTRGSFRNIAIP